jgi:hypothetical protein
MEQRGAEGSFVAVRVRPREGYTGSNWSHRNSNKRVLNKFGSRIMKTLNRLTTKDSCTWNFPRNTEFTAV